MDASWRTTGDVARLLSTTVPRVLRASGHVQHEHRGNRAVFDEHGVAALRQLLGAAPQHSKYSREELFVLKALSVRPFGLTSARQVAIAASVSPTCASNALRHLSEGRLVERVPVRRPWNGKVVTRGSWQIRWLSKEWADMGPAARRTVLPAKATRPRTEGLHEVAHLLWSGLPGAYDKDRDAVLITRRVLESKDPRALGWLADEIPAATVLEAARGRGLDRRARKVAEALACR